MNQLILTCEHAGNRVPASYAPLFCAAGEALTSHRGWDPGSLAMAKAFQRRFAAPLFCSTVTRLLVDLNRSLGHRRLFSEFTAGLDDRAKHTLLQRHYYPHRNRVESWIGKQLQEDGLAVLHLSLHTFAATLNGQSRNADAGLLYDPSREEEKSLCNRWCQAFKNLRPELRMRRNYPYLGKADGLTTYLRRRFPDKYAGIELEVNQLWIEQQAADRHRFQRDLAESLAAVWQKEKK